MELEELVAQLSALEVPETLISEIRTGYSGDVSGLQEKVETLTNEVTILTQEKAAAITERDTAVERHGKVQEHNARLLKLVPGAPGSDNEQNQKSDVGGEDTDEELSLDDMIVYEPKE